jgi:hypothetical protein
VRPRARHLAALFALALTGAAIAPLGAGPFAAAPPAAVQTPTVTPSDSPSGGGPAPIRYARDIRPILANRCFKCHGPDEAARQGKLRLDTPEGATAPRRHPAIVPGDPAASELLARVTAADPDDLMPPPDAKLPALTAAEVELLRNWIAQGATWEEHWSFVAPVDRTPPAVLDHTWARGPIDSWVLARLDAEGLKPAPQAPGPTLLRRASLDLIGLPPTIEEQDAFLADTSALGPDLAYERAVDRLLASDRYGEKWARWWLDLARYADSMGYEKDRGRTIWPYRDWVIRALNADMPFDRFTELQLAGDMMPASSDAQTQDNLLATAFHRNTMTNDEGGTDDEEFRVAAIVDRVNTTMEVWQGLTMACAQCHTHKYDPLPQKDYYKVFAIFNNTEDADRPDDAPLVPYIDDASRAKAGELDGQIARLEAWVVAEAAQRTETREQRTGSDTRSEQAGDGDAESQRTPDQLGLEVPRDRVWIDDVLPPGAVEHLEGAPSPSGWPWIDAVPETAPAVGAAPGAVIAPAHGTRSFGATFPGQGQQFITDAFPPLPVGAGDSLFVSVWLDPANPPKTIMLQWFAGQAGWEHRAYWGDPSIHYGGAEGSSARLRRGDLPEPGRWVRLEIPAADLALEGENITGWAFSQLGGRVLWDAAGVRTTHAWADSYLASFDAWLPLARANEGRGLPDDVRPAVTKPPADVTPEDLTKLRAYYLRNVHEATRLRLAPREAELSSVRRERDMVLSRGARVPVMHELASDRRTTHRFERGSFLSPAEEIEPGVPEILCDKAVNERPRNRRELAAWLASPQNPLTARVIANRIWEQLFGIGIVETLEDFGTQGSPPSHPELLDHLAISLRQHSWSLKSLLREIVTSATYRQTSAAPDELFARDPYNRLLARGARFRLDGETIRDQALAASGLLSPKMYGPPVYPPQPDGLWNMVIYSGDRWDTSQGDDRHRRGLYTFWRRTVPYPSMTTFDAPSREFCVSRRIRTNTPLQAYVTLNDPAFVECAAALAQETERREQRTERREQESRDSARIDTLFRLVLARQPTPEESAEVLRLVADQRARYAADPQAAAKVVGETDKGTDEGTKRRGEEAENLADRAAWISACSVVLNLDETLTRE